MKETLYIGPKFILAYALNERSFLKQFKKEDNINRKTQPGYVVKYSDGHISWLPKKTFETAYRKLPKAENRDLTLQED